MMCHRLVALALAAACDTVARSDKPRLVGVAKALGAE